jgi:hypothetical protein
VDEKRRALPLTIAVETGANQTLRSDHADRLAARRHQLALTRQIGANLRRYNTKDLDFRQVTIGREQ